MIAKKLLSQVRDAEWLTARSAAVYAIFALVLTGLLPIVVRLLGGDGEVDRQGSPYGGDYISFYAASKLALQGHGVQAWQPQLHEAAQHAVFGDKISEYWAFFYPPAYLLLCLPLALVSYGWSVLIAMSATSLAFLATGRAWLKRQWPDIKGYGWPLIAFPGIWMNIACGQNAALTTAIMLGGCLLLPRAPILSGVIFGLMVIKPQLALALPFILAADGRWKTFFATGFSALGLSLIALAVFGPDAYAAFFANSALARATLEKGLVAPEAMQSVFAACKQLGAPNILAYAMQALAAAAVLARSIYIIRRHRPDYLALGALLASATLLLSPFLLNYDLLMLAVPLGWLVLQGAREEFRPWEKMLCIWLFLLPALARGLTEMLHVPVGALSLCLLFWLVQGRITKPADIAMPAGLKMSQA